MLHSEFFWSWTDFKGLYLKKKSSLISWGGQLMVWWYFLKRFPYSIPWQATKTTKQRQKGEDIIGRICSRVDFHYRVIVTYFTRVNKMERRSMTSRHHGNTLSGWQLNQRRRRLKANGQKVKGFNWQNNTFARASRYLDISLPSLHPCDMKLPNLTRLLYGVGEHNTKVVFFPL